ncbi:MAG TPA: phosphatidylserine decarboxylase [Candidatus Binataceae bacterium]|nr:phosphatidylserine decarboxylase [Candidatus Binataceae bacterium]
MGKLAELIGLAPEGGRLAFGILIVGLILLFAGFPLLGLFVVLVAVAVGSFFRDPERFPERSDGVVISAADGKVTDIAQCPLPDDRETVYHRVSVFMSPLNVHVNRASAAGEVTMVEHTPGDFFAAYRDSASEQNERNLIVIRDAAGRRHAIMQIAGYLARRIICRVHPHDKVEMGQRIGLIMFGSRVDHFIPSDYRVTVRVGERVLAGETVIGELLGEDNESKSGIAARPS